VIALPTVRTWLEEKHLQSGRYFSHGHCVCRFYRYRPAIVSSGLATDHDNDSETTTTTTTTPPPAVAAADDVSVVVVDDTIRLAAQLLDSADAVLIVAGAGMSGNPDEMVSTNPDDFAFYYPWFTEWGYHTGYEAMGLLSDPSVPMTAKWAFWATHTDKMRWQFPPNYLQQLVHDKEYFVHTSNVDG
jgi:hypothetical protein